MPAYTPSQLRQTFGDPSNRTIPPKNMPDPEDWKRMQAQQQADSDEIRRNRGRVKPKGQPTPKAPSAWQKGLSAVGRALTSIPGRAAGGIGLALYPSELGSGTMDSPEAQRAIARNAAKKEQPPEIGFPAPGQPGSDVPFLVQPGLPPAERAAEIERQAAAVREQVTSADELRSQGLPSSTPPKKPLAGTGPNSNLPFPIPPEVAERGQRNIKIAGLMDEGFGLLKQQPGARDEISGGLNLGPNNIMVRERLGTPEDYTSALQSREAAMARGQAAGMPQSAIGGDYRPSEATRAYAEKGGPITEYAVPGKGTATFMGERQGGGTFSVVGGRTPEEQALINQRVAGIDSQTAALRQLREAQNPGITTGRRRGYERPPLGVFDRPGDGFGDAKMREARYNGMMERAANARGITRAQRQAMVDAAQGMLAPGNTAVAADTANRKTQMDGLMQTQAQDIAQQQAQRAEQQAQRAAEQAQRKDQQAQQQWQDNFNQSDRHKAGELAIDVWKTNQRNRPGSPEPMTQTELSTFLKRYDSEATPGNPSTFRRKQFHSENGIVELPPLDKAQAGKPYYDPSSNLYVFATKKGVQPILGGGLIDMVRYLDTRSKLGSGAGQPRGASSESEED